MRDALIRNVSVTAVLVCASLAIAACGSKIEGTYTDPGGAFTLELKSGGKANFTFAGEVADCTYTVEGKIITMGCKGGPGKVNLTVHDDGMLTGPPGTFMPALRKTK